jgi:hypothetical protein
MDRSNHKDCYGKLFPETLHPDGDHPVQGKVFAYQLLTAGGMFRSDRSISVDIPAWDDCLNCEDFDSCFKLSLGKLALETAITDK